MMHIKSSTGRPLQLNYIFFKKILIKCIEKK